MQVRDEHHHHHVLKRNTVITGQGWDRVLLKKKGWVLVKGKRVLLHMGQLSLSVPVWYKGLIQYYCSPPNFSFRRKGYRKCFTYHWKPSSKCLCTQIHQQHEIWKLQASSLKERSIKVSKMNSQWGTGYGQQHVTFLYLSLDTRLLL